MDAGPEHGESAPSPATGNWIGPDEIRAIAGALKPAAYVARAYLHCQEHAGKPPAWANKLPNGRWLFDRSYVESDAADHVAFVGISEAAAIAGVSRRTIQNWIDEGAIPVEGGERSSGAPRRIRRDEFLRLYPTLVDRRPRAAPLPSPAGENTPPELLHAFQTLNSARALQRRSRQSHSLASQRIRSLASREHDLAREVASLKRDFDSRLRKLESQLSAAQRQREAAESSARKAAAEESSSVDNINRIIALVSRKLRDLGRKSPQKHPPAPPAKQPAPAAEARSAPAREASARREKAESLARRLQTAKEERARTTSAAHQLAGRIASRILQDVDDGKLPRSDVSRYYQALCERNQIPPEIRKEAFRDAASRHRRSDDE